MRRLHLAVVASSLIAASSSSHAADSASGRCSNDGATLEIVDAVSYSEPNTFDETKQDLVLVLTNVKLDKAAIGAAGDKEDAVRDQVWNADDGGKVELHVNDANEVWAMHYNRGGTSFSQSGSAVGEFVLSKNDGKRVAGTFKLEGEGDELGCDLAFDLSSTALAEAVASAPPKPVGKPLAKGGGEPGRVFMANHAAMRKGDVDAMLGTVTSDKASQMKAMRSEPEFPQMLEMMKAFAPVSVAVVSGEDFGDTAELEIEGKDDTGAAMYGTTQMVKEGGAWKVDETSMSNTPK